MSAIQARRPATASPKREPRKAIGNKHGRESEEDVPQPQCPLRGSKGGHRQGQQPDGQWGLVEDLAAGAVEGDPLAGLQRASRDRGIEGCVPICQWKGKSSQKNRNAGSPDPAEPPLSPHYLVMVHFAPSMQRGWGCSPNPTRRLDAGTLDQ